MKPTHTPEEKAIMDYLEKCINRLHKASLTMTGAAKRSFQDAAAECSIIQTDIMSFKHRYERTAK